MIDDIVQDAKQRMEKSVEVLKSDLSRLRTGRAHPSLLEPIQVNYYGSDTPLKQVANIGVEDARTLTVTPWEKQLTPDIEKAIMNANLGLNPVTAGSVIRVPLPPLTEERRREMAKLVKQEGESSKVAIRNIRRDANGDFKDLVKDKEISEDDERRAQEDIQKLTDTYVKKVDDVIDGKEQELMEV